ncbi:MAG: hypothetical protein L0177_19840 [Chloroflexi bacterium]|nr:hypothetical protein [Chloroflexota bacterium]
MDNERTNAASSGRSTPRARGDGGGGLMTPPIPDRVWEAVLGELQLQVTRPSFETWLKDTVGVSCDGGELVVGAPNRFVADMLEGRMYSLIAQAVERVLNRSVEIRFEVISAVPITPAEPPDPCPDSEHSHRIHETREELFLHLSKHLRCLKPWEYLRGGWEPLMETLDQLTSVYGWKLDHPRVNWPPGMLSYYLDLNIERHKWRAKTDADARAVEGGQR